jgi:hypothetical protein
MPKLTQADEQATFLPWRTAGGRSARLSNSREGSRREGGGRMRVTNGLLIAITVLLSALVAKVYMADRDACPMRSLRRQTSG